MSNNYAVVSWDRIVNETLKLRAKQFLHQFLSDPLVNGKLIVMDTLVFNAIKAPMHLVKVFGGVYRLGKLIIIPVRDYNNAPFFYFEPTVSNIRMINDLLKQEGHPGLSIMQVDNIVVVESPYNSNPLLSNRFGR